MPASWDQTTPWDDTELPALSPRAIAGLVYAIGSSLLAMAALALVYVNAHPRGDASQVV
jgi:hypothetical protein